MWELRRVVYELRGPICFVGLVDSKFPSVEIAFS